MAALLEWWQGKNPIGSQPYLEGMVLSQPQLLLQGQVHVQAQVGAVLEHPLCDFSPVAAHTWDLSLMIVWTEEFRVDKLFRPDKVDTKCPNSVGFGLRNTGFTFL